MGVAVVGGGIAGLFTAFYLEAHGADVTLFETGAPGARSVHAAGIIEPGTAYRTNTFAFLRRVVRLWSSNTCRIRRVDPRWLVVSARWLERRPAETMDETLRAMGQESRSAYAALAERADDFGFSPGGLLETFDSPSHFEEQYARALMHRSAHPVEVRDVPGTAGGLYFPDVAWLDTDRFIERIVRELRRTRIVRGSVRSVSLDGTVTTDAGSARFDSVAVATGVSSRGLGLPITGVRGYGWHVRSRTPIERATIAVDRGIALVPCGGSLKVTGGWDFDLSIGGSGAPQVLGSIRRLVNVDEVLDFREGSRPCTPDGLPTVGRKERVVIANGGFRLGWSFAPAMGRAAAELCLGKATNDPFLSRFCGSVRSGTLG